MGDEGAAEGRDRAERAAPVAAGGQLHRGHRAAAETAAQRGPRSGGRCDALRQILGRTHRRSRLTGNGLGVAGQRDRGVLALGRADRQQLASVARGVRGVDATAQDGLQAAGDIAVVVEAEHTVRLGQRLGELLAVALGHAADGHYGLGSAVILQIVGFQQGIDGVLLGGLDETTGVDDGDIGIGGFLDELPAVRCQAACELLRVHLVTGTAKSDKGDGTAFGHRPQPTLSRPPPWRAGLRRRTRPPGPGGGRPLGRALSPPGGPLACS